MPAEPSALLRALAAANPLRGAGRSRGELLKGDIRVATWTVQRYLRGARPPRRAGRRRATFLRHHAPEIWAGDVLAVAALLSRPVDASFVIALGSRRVLHVGVPRHPTDARAARQLREATPCEQRARHLLRDNDGTYGQAFARVAEASGIAVLRTACGAPRQHAAGARFLGSVRRAGSDRVLVPGAAQLRRLPREDARSSHAARPRQGRRHRPPDRAGGALPRPQGGGRVRAVPVLGGPHRAHRRAA